jgi:2-keto-4-pentenoate hydratase/2-oxohepta-3-ene-1,7-dioic acid hydratase in catechol pathway
MRLVGYRRPGASADDRRVGRLTDAGIVDIGPGDVSGVVRGDMAAAAGETIDPASVKILAPIRHPGKIVCIGLNYHDHCREQNIQPPAYPMLFSKFDNAINDPGGIVVRPRATEKLDAECELALVIGRRASRIGREEAMEHLFGYTVINDVTMRDLQREDKQWLRAKGSDGFAPLGPMVVTRDEIADPQHLPLRTTVNGEVWQDSSTAEMIFDVPTLIAFISQTITLLPGDVIATGTPAGVGHYQDPPRYLRDGDLVRCEIEGIGVLESRIVDELPRIPDHAAAAGVGVLETPATA